MCAGVLAYECDGPVEDVGLYKDGALAVLSGGDSRAAQAGVAGQRAGRLALLPSSALARQPLPAAALSAGPTLSYVRNSSFLSLQSFSCHLHQSIILRSHSLPQQL